MSSLFFLLLKFLLGKEVEQIAIIYATLIVKGAKSIADVPATIRESVKQVLIDLDCAELAQE